MQFLQWMSLRRNKHPLVMGVLFLVIFYVCVNILIAAFGLYSTPERVPFSAFFVPSPVYLLDHSAWALRPAIWGAGFIVQWIVIVAFMWLQKRTLDEMVSPASASSPAPAPAL
jgi:hypothetical protein